MDTTIVEQSDLISEYGLMLLEVLVLSLVGSVAYFTRQLLNNVTKDIDDMNLHVHNIIPRLVALEENKDAFKEDIIEIQDDIKKLQLQTVSNQKELTEKISTYNTDASKELQKVQLQLGKILGYLEKRK